MGAYIIAEAGVNHNGRLDLAKELCLAAKNAGADCVKFQTWQTEKIITRHVAQADYQADNTGRTESQFDMLKRLELSYDDFRAVKAYCDEIGIQFASTADEPDSLDFQIALSRVALDDTEEAVRLAEQELAGEYRELLLFLFKPEARPNGPFTFQAVWMTAALVKSPDTVYDEFKDFPYSAVNRAYLTGDIPCDVFTFEKPFGKVDRILQLIPPASKNVAIKWRFGGYALYMAYRPCSRIPLLVETFWKVPLREKDLKRFLLLSPNAPRIWLALLVRDRVRDAYWNDLELARLNLVALDTLRELDLEWRGGMALTYLAVCLLSIDRPVRLCAANLWGELVEKDLIDNVALGRVLGKIQALEWAPAQRISGLVVEMLINRSSFHNKELSVLFVSFLSCLPENPVKDLKRLLEVFAELQTVNNWPKVTYAPLLCLLETWKKNSKLTEVIESLY